jgi:hypothetical protein
MSRIMNKRGEKWKFDGEKQITSGRAFVIDGTGDQKEGLKFTCLKSEQQ